MVDIYIYFYFYFYASIYVLHGDDASISFSSAEYFYDNRECNFDPINFIVGTYYKVSAK